MRAIRERFFFEERTRARRKASLRRRAGQRFHSLLARRRELDAMRETATCAGWARAGRIVSVMHDGM